MQQWQNKNINAAAKRFRLLEQKPLKQILTEYKEQVVLQNNNEKIIITAAVFMASFLASQSFHLITYGIK